VWRMRASGLAGYVALGQRTRPHPHRRSGCGCDGGSCGARCGRCMFCAGRACRMASDIDGDDDDHPRTPPLTPRRPQMERRTIVTRRATADAAEKARAYGYGVVG